MKNKLKKILGVLLSVAIISNSVDVAALTVWAAENTGDGASIVAFEALPDAVRNQFVGEGGTEADIQFPGSLNVTVQRAVTVQTPVETVIPVETMPDSVSAGDAEVIEVAVDYVSGGDALEPVAQIPVMEMVEETQVVEETLALEVLGWKIDTANSVSDSFVADASTYGFSYTYIPELNLVDGGGNVLSIAEGVMLPTITVTIGPVIEGAGEAKFTVNYYVEVEPGSDPRAIAVQNPKNPAETKYFLHMEQLAVNYTEGKAVGGGYSPDTGAQMVRDVDTRTEISSTKRNYDCTEPAHDYYTVTGSETNGGEGTVTADNSLTFNFYWKTVTYSEYHLTEVETSGSTSGLVSYNGKYYQILKTNEVKVTAENVGTTVTIPDLSGTGEFEGYTAVTAQSSTYPTSGTVDAKGQLSLYRFYDQNPTCNYTVTYYVEVYEHQKDGSNITVNVNGTDKYYNRITDSAYNMACQAPEGTIITVAESSSDIPGVYAGGVKVSDTWKGYTTTLRKYSYDTTVAYGKHTGAVAADGSLQIVLFYDWLDSVSATAKYTEKYYVECKIQNTTNYDIDVDGVKYELLHEDEKTGTVGTEVTIGAITWEEQESYYPLSATDEHPTKAVIAAGGTTVLYQFYRLHPHYQVIYYTEAEDGTISFGGKNYNWERTTLFTGRAPKGTVVSYRKLDDGGAIITTDGTDVANSSKTYADYELNEEITNQYGSGSKTLVEGSRETIILFFDKVVPTTTYTEEYYVELYNQNDASYDLIVDGRKYERTDIKTLTAEYDETVTITDLSSTPAYNGYVLMPATAQYPSEVSEVAEDGSTKVYQIYRRLPGVKMQPYLEVKGGNGENIIRIGERYFEKVDFYSLSGGTRRGTYVYVEDAADGTTKIYQSHVGTCEGDTLTESYDRLYLPEGYAIDAEITRSRKQYPYKIELDKDSTIEVFYKKAPSTANYTEQYYVELEDQNATVYNLEVGGVKYKLQESNSQTIEKEMGARIIDKSTQSPYVDCELQPATTTYPSEVDDVADDNSTVLYQFYRLQPKYSVRYYKEVEAGTTGAVSVGSKYYVLAERFSGEARTNSAIAYAERTDGTVGIAVNSVERADSFKSYANYVFNADTTVLNNKTTATVTRDAENVIELFFDKARTASYRCEYYVELENQDTTDFDKKIEGVKYELKDSYTVAGVAYDARVEIADKSAEYAALGYDLMPDTTEYPSWCAKVNEDGTTVLYQVYRLRPGYTVRYYTETDAESASAVKVGDKYYVLQEQDTIANYATEGTVITYAELHTGAGVAEDGGAVPETVRSYDGYAFSSIASRLKGNVYGTVSRDSKVVIELFFDMVRTDYTEVYWIENPDATTDYIEVKIDGAVRKFVVGKTYVVEDEWIHAKVAVRDREDEFAGYKAVYDDVTNYSSVAYGLNGDGSTQVHRFYVLKPESGQTTSPDAVLPDDKPGISNEPIRKKAPKTGDKGNWRNALLSICAAYIAALLWKRRNQ